MDTGGRRREGPRNVFPSELLQPSPCPLTPAPHRQPLHPQRPLILGMWQRPPESPGGFPNSPDTFALCFSQRSRQPVRAHLAPAESRHSPHVCDSASGLFLPPQTHVPLPWCAGLSAAERALLSIC